jgi:hypothetical protein
VVVNAPDGPPEGDGLVWFSSCTMAEGASSEDALGAHKKLSAAYREMGSQAQSWAFFPGLGAGDIEFDYYSVVTFKNYAELAASWDMYANKGGHAKGDAAMKGKTNCDSPRLYEAMQVKAGKSSG